VVYDHSEESVYGTYGYSYKTPVCRLPYPNLELSLATAGVC